jgi:hypothetical protein
MKYLSILGLIAISVTMVAGCSGGAADATNSSAVTKKFDKNSLTPTGAETPKQAAMKKAGSQTGLRGLVAPPGQKYGIPK